MKPDFNTMSIVELRAYLLTHRNDDEAFYKLADLLETSPNSTDLYPILDTPENIALMEAAIREQVQKLEEKRRG
jgi:hypothetical protein